MYYTEISFYAVAYFISLVDFNVDMIQYIVLFFLTIWLWYHS
jgi:hypothetical protein